MDEFVDSVKRNLLYVLAWFVFLSVGAFTGGKAHVVPGLALGTAASIIYFLLMCYRVKKSAGMPPAKAVSYMRAGWIIRLGFIVAVLIVSLKVPAIYFPAAVVGLFSLQIILYGNALLTVLKSFLSGIIPARKG